MLAIIITASFSSNNTMSKFQLITLAIFVISIVAGVTAFALYKGGPNPNKLASITIWGTFPAETFNLYVNQVNNLLADPLTIKYVEERPENFSQDFISALARRNGPDAILIPADNILPHEDKIAPILYQNIPQRTFVDTYIQEANIYLDQKGIWAIPFTVDPLVMYWNRDMFDAAGIPTYPKTWDEFTALNKKLTVKDQNGTVHKTAIAMGDFSNVLNAREILASLFLQTSNPITQINSDQNVVSTIAVGNAANPVPALQFFSQFVDPTNVNYSWNRSMPDSKKAFLSGTSATYFGFASELASIRARNPNLNFDVASLPQAGSGGTKATYAKMLGFSLVKSSPNTLTAFKVISTLTAPQYMAKLAQTLYAASPRRDVIAQSSPDQYISIFNQSALIAKTWLDVDPVKSEQLFGDMINSLTSGEKTVFQAVQDMKAQYDIILRKSL